MDWQLCMQHQQLVTITPSQTVTALIHCGGGRGLVPNAYVANTIWLDILHGISYTPVELYSPVSIDVAASCCSSSDTGMQSSTSDWLTATAGPLMAAVTLWLLSPATSLYVFHTAVMFHIMEVVTCKLLFTARNEISTREQMWIEMQKQKPAKCFSCFWDKRPNDLEH